ncbi:hypothetical protein AWH69_07360 [Janibacter melonis]|uniref:Uncharacterized protein n=1 Tax=Janibacter melonis TaxID=262209 RepID=A0A176QDT8_9MICO|nr:hypothetical protein [Janibacter melonis]MBD5831241.1 hypothetical protein [Janibacter melonis]OAB87842.1 hypothetical protein AWH69_07360 [Janibacter melonis]
MAGFWRSALGDDQSGFRLVVGMCLFWVGPLMFGAMGVLAGRPGMVLWSVVAAVGWVLAWTVMIVRHRRCGPGERVDLTPTVPMILPGVLMVAGVVGALMSF